MPCHELGKVASVESVLRKRHSRKKDNSTPSCFGPRDQLAFFAVRHKLLSTPLQHQPGSNHFAPLLRGPPFVFLEKNMGIGKVLVCLFLLLILLLYVEAAYHGGGNSQFSKFKGSSCSGSAKKAHKNGENAEKDCAEIFGAEKRRVYTGPNPLHNR